MLIFNTLFWQGTYSQELMCLILPIVVRCQFWVLLCVLVDSYLTFKHCLLI